MYIYIYILYIYIYSAQYQPMAESTTQILLQIHVLNVQWNKNNSDHW